MVTVHDLQTIGNDDVSDDMRGGSHWLYEVSWCGMRLRQTPPPDSSDIQMPSPLQIRKLESRVQGAGRGEQIQCIFWLLSPVGANEIEYHSMDEARL